MSIFKKARAMPIVRSVVSQGMDDDYQYDYDESWRGYSDGDGSRAALDRLIDGLQRDGDYEDAEFCRELHEKGYGYQQIRDMLMSIQSIRR